MKLLFFTSKPIFPSVDGGCFASEKFVKCLFHAGIEVHYATLSTPKHTYDRTAFPVEFLEKCEPKSFSVNTNVRPIPAFLHLFKSASYNCNRFYSASVENALCEWVKTENFDGIVLDSLYTLPYLTGLRAVFNGKIIVRTHNVEHQLWEQYAADAKGIKKWYLKRLANDLKRFEIEQLNAVDGIFSISKDDSEIFRSLGIRTVITEIPVPVSVLTQHLAFEGTVLYYIGAMDWKPNQQAVAELILWMPRLREKLPQLELHTAGSKSKAVIPSDEKNGIFVHGYVNSVEDFALEHGILVSPIHTASGVRIKFLEAMAAGIPIITTKVGALGIDLNPPTCICIAETEAEFAQQINTLVLDQNKRREIGTNAQRYIEKNHNIDAISQAIVEIFQGNT